MSAPSQLESTPRSNAMTWVIIALVATLVLAGVANLWPQWRHNPDLSHAWFTPLIFVLLIHEARSRGTLRFLPAGPMTFFALGLTLLVGLMLLATGGLYMAALERTHSLVAIAMTAALCTLLAATWIYFALGTVRRVPFNWPAGVAIFLWLLSAPLPPGTYASLTLGMQAWVTNVVLALLQLFGIAAVKHGNIIELANVSVGVEEACSGVRSLLSCIYAGFFFSAAMVRAPFSRLLVIGLSAPLAIGMNVLRSLTLTLLASNGVEIRGAWHDATGFAILGATAVMLAGLAHALNRRSMLAHDGGGICCEQAPAFDRPASGALPMAGTPANGFLSRPTRRARAVLAGGLALAVVLVCACVVNTRPSRRSPRPPPDLAAVLPAQSAGWDVSTSEDLYRFSAQLQTDHLVQRTYGRSTPAGDTQITIYLAHWATGRAPVSLVASHTPDACWPGVGWIAHPTPPPAAPVAVGGRALAGTEYRLFEQNGFPQHVWYWHLFDGRPIQTGEVRSPRRLLQLALRYGFRRDGEQVFVRISSNRPWETFAEEPLMKEIFARLERFGL